MSLTKVPSIPVPTPSNQLDVTRAIKSILDVREGYIGDPLDQNVTYRDLITSGIAQLSTAGVQGTGLLPPIEIPGIVGGYNPVTDYTPPDAPTGLTVTSGKTLIKLKWDLWTSQNHAYAEVWRSTSNAIGSALLIGTSDTQYYVDSLGETGAAYYYWIRFVSQANIFGPYNSTNGTTATSGLIDNADIANLDAAKITTGFLSANRIQAGSLDAKIANLDAAVITSGYIGAARINTASIANANITAAQIASGFIDAARINTASISNATIGTAQITGVLSANQINGQNLVVYGGDFSAAYSWPWPAGKQGFHLSQYGLLIGDYYGNRYIQFDKTGNIFSPNFSFVSGTLYIGEVTLTRTTRLAGGTYTIPTAIVAAFNGDAGVWYLTTGASGDGFYAGNGEFFIDTGYNDYTTITDTTRPVYTAKVLPSYGRHWYSGSGPGSAKVADWPIEVNVISTLDFYTVGASGAVPGGRLYLHVRVHPPRNVNSTVYQLQLEQVTWSINRVT